MKWCNNIKISQFLKADIKVRKCKRSQLQNFICPGPEIAWNLSQKVRKSGQNKKFSRKPGLKSGMLRYAKLQNYIETILFTFCTANLECLWSAFWYQTCLHYNLENDLFGLEITWNFITKINWEPCLQQSASVCCCSCLI